MDPAIPNRDDPLLQRARASLADEPPAPAPPADGEVAELVADLQQQANHGFSDLTRNLLISLASHMAYMQGQLEARHELDDPEDYYWYRESVLLRQKVADHLAALTDEPAVPQGREPAAVTGQPSDEELADTYWKAWHEYHDRTNSVLHSVGLRAVLARWGNPAPAPPADGEVAELVAWLKENAEDERQMSGGDNPASLKLDRAAELLERLASPACEVLKPSPELIEAFQDALPGRIEPLLEERHPAPVPVGERLPQPEVGE